MDSMKNSLMQFFVFCSLLAGCGLKVISPADENPNKGTLAVDWSGDGPKVVGTFTCRMKSMGNRFFGFGKSEDEARQDAMGKCKSHTLLSFCEKEKITCEKN
ncbi:double-stranded RNA binding motif domain-containing protein [Bdellovibrio bacteriovorus]|uniref:Lipoprotein n=1 Tax=Bdellovibrio bacteriovorus str. Tiberius TaxID=1069642 RepID=K7YV65_BDEBC|nr:double-stranded RNA binding motif domain-containing protein [Bdellovibrio bacteriovorus]AFY01548.1 hypothetical protein Bdt_1861 [Bdellovibrio bacteriovorus str. Tiberius]